MVSGSYLMSLEKINRSRIFFVSRDVSSFVQKGNEHLIEQFQEEVDRRWEDLQFKCSR